MCYNNCIHTDSWTGECTKPSNIPYPCQDEDEEPEEQETE